MLAFWLIFQNCRHAAKVPFPGKWTLTEGDMGWLAFVKILGDPEMSCQSDTSKRSQLNVTE